MAIVEEIAMLLRNSGETLSTAESCTGGLLGHLLTNQPGSSDWYLGGAVSYSNTLKQRLLGVRTQTLAAYGAVSVRVATEMAEGARAAFNSDYAISVTGIAGPGGGSDEKPVGLVYVGIATPDETQVERYQWHGSREANKLSSAHAAFEQLVERLRERLPRSALVRAELDPAGRVRPVGFDWEGRAYRVTDWGRQWEEQGRRHFLVMTSGPRVWELRLEPKELRWSIHPRTSPLNRV